MAKSARADGTLKIAQDGSIQFNVTTGETPLPPASGSGMSFQNAAAMMAEIEAAEAAIGALLPMILLGQWLKANPNMTNPGAIAGKTCTLDLTGSSITVQLT